MVEEGVALEQLDAAAGVGRVIAQHARADGIGPAAGPALAAAVLAVDAPAGKQLHLRLGRIARGQQPGDVGGIILAIAIQGGDPGRPRMLDAGAHRGALAALVHMVQHAQFRRGGLQPLQHGQGVIARVIVDVDDLERYPATQRRGDFGDQRGDIVALVEHGDDNGKLG
ncbi:hypothetical protein G6F40_014823 [Rhizopus arrhizus]|nr:hypothetical protein G6F40_014823 [Rhizopus arrhizus]